MLILGMINVGVVVGLFKQNKMAFILALFSLLYWAYGILGGIIAFRKEDSTFGSYLSILSTLSYFAVNIFSIIYLIRRLKIKRVTH